MKRNVLPVFFSVLLIFPFCAFLFPPKAFAATITVSSGTSIQAAVNQARPGDIIHIRAGTYNERVSISRSGTASAPIKLMGYPGEKPIIDGQNTRSAGISITGSYVTVSGLKVTNHTDDDIHIDGASNVTLDGLDVYITGRAIKIENSNNVTVKNSTITTPEYVARQTDGIYSQKNKNNTYENNSIIIYNSHAAGHDDAIQMYKDDSIIVRGNYLAQVNDKTSNAQCLYATTMYGTSKFYNNVINMGNAQSNALSFRRLPSLGGTGTVEMVGNTVYGKRPYHGIWITETDNPVVKNNLIYILSGAALTLSGSSNAVSNNLINTDPKFININTQDFRLQGNSPAIDKGASLGAPYTVDKDGNPRPQGAAWDIGAYEYGAQSAPLPGDFYTDGKINIIDFTLFMSYWFLQNMKVDLDGDGKINVVDYTVFMNLWYGTHR